jgi:threonine 3-dehydrogenase
LRLPSVIGAGRGPGGASAYSSLMVSEPAQGRPYVAPVSERARIPIVYIKDAVAALVQLAEADASRLRYGTYGMPGLSPTAGELAAAVRMVIPGAEIAFSPDVDVMDIIDSWPRQVDGSAALRDWDWAQTHTLPDLVADFVAELSGAEARVKVLAN